MSEKPDGPAMQVNFRMPLGLKDMLQKAADGAGRSLTQEINQRLLDSFSFIHIPADLRQRLHAAAESNGASLQKEIEIRLEDSFSSSGPSPQQLIEDYRRLVEETLRDTQKTVERLNWVRGEELSIIYNRLKALADSGKPPDSETLRLTEMYASRYPEDAVEVTARSVRKPSKS